MRRRTILVASLVAALVVVGVPPAHAGDTVVFRPPFKLDSGLGYSLFERCREASRAESAETQGAALSVVEGIAGCDAEAGLTVTWAVGRIPRALVGRPATVTMRLKVEDSFVGAAGGGRRHAQIALSVANARSWRLVRIRCDDGCRRDGVALDREPRTLVLQRDVTSLPRTIEMTLFTSSSITDGPGRVRASLDATIGWIKIAPA